jgi:hypothetical protein
MDPFAVDPSMPENGENQWIMNEQFSVGKAVGTAYWLGQFIRGRLHASGSSLHDPVVILKVVHAFAEGLWGRAEPVYPQLHIELID